MVEFRLRNQLDPEALKARIGKILLPTDVDVMLTGPSRVLKPDGSLLCVYVPGAISDDLKKQSEDALDHLRGSYTNNRGMAAGGERIKGPSNRTYSRQVDSAIIGSFEAQGPKAFCRLTAWTRDELDKHRSLYPLFQRIGQLMAEHVPERYAVQAREAQATAPEWVIPGTPFTTITINHTWATAVHTDKGDLHDGFSTLVVFRKGEYKGGWLCFPEYRLAADLQDGDLILMDAHEWHGNTQFDPEPERRPDGQLIGDPGYERVSVVSYFRTNMVKCGSARDEAEKRRIVAENRQAALVGE